MKYGIDFRFLPKGGDKPIENTSYSKPVDVEVDDEQYALIPEVGDYVHLQGEEGFRNVPILGRVRSRFFEYQLSYCYVTVVVEEVDADWDKIKPQ